MIKVSIVTPSGSIFDGKLKEVVLPGTDGEFGVVNGHSDLFTLLQPGIVDLVDENGQKNMITINWGFCLVHTRADDTRVDILIDGAIVLGESKSEIAKNLESARELLRSASNDNMTLSSTFAKIEHAIKD